MVPSGWPVAPAELAAVVAVSTMTVATAALAEGTGPHDSNLPIEITADSLEVVQNQQIATFTGNVDAVQGDMVLSADRLRVYYYGDSDDGAPAGRRQLDPADRGRGQRVPVVAAGDRAGRHRRLRRRRRPAHPRRRGGADPGRQRDPRRTAGDRSGERPLARVRRRAERRRRRRRRSACALCSRPEAARASGAPPDQPRCRGAAQ